MCGICGIANGSNIKQPIDPASLRQMCATIRHRGPDDEYVWTDGVVGLGQRRLAIIDPSLAGRQPMSNETGTIWLTFNGEIYNFLEWRKILKDKGHLFRSQTDTETIIHLYEEKGLEALEHLRGMFAFALWDSEQRQLFLARDRLGQKPLYYGIFNNRLYFASEIKAILALPEIPRRINWRGIDHYLTYHYVPGDLTAFEGIYKLLPAHYLLWKDGNVTIKRYWHLDFLPKLNLPEAKAQEQLLALLEEAVKYRLISDVPLGAFLSGGVDSSTVVALMSQFSSVRTFSVGFPEEGMSELPFARQVARRFNTEHQEFIVEAKALEVLPHLVWHYDEPFADASAIPTYYVSQVTRQFVTVALSGDGGDESFGGYQRYRPRYHRSPFDWMPLKLRRPLLKSISHLLPNHLLQTHLSWRLRYHLGAAATSPFGWYMRSVRLFSADQKNLLYSDAMRDNTRGIDAEEWYKRFYSEIDTLHPIEKAMKADIATYLPDAMLVKVDVASMANSLEVRSPFLDYKVIEFAARLPLEYKVRDGVGKYLLKKTLERYLPPEILYRRKKGFSIPLAKWLRGNMRHFAQEILFDVGQDLPYFRSKQVQRLFVAHLERKGNYATHLWAIINLYLWHRMFIDKTISPPEEVMQ